MLGKGFKYLQRNTVAADYIRKAYGSIMKIGKLDLISVLVMQTYEIIKEMELAEELVNEDLINRITATQEKDEDLKNSVLALIGLLTENGHYDKALSLVSGLLEYSGIGK